jgi:hypothetical protein
LFPICFIKTPKLAPRVDSLPVSCAHLMAPTDRGRQEWVPAIAGVIKPTRFVLFVKRE